MTPEDEARGQWHFGEMINPLPQSPLHSVLRWILDHLNAGCARFVGDGEDPPAHSVVLGQMASTDASAKDAVKAVTARFLAVDVAGIFATARERGIEPEAEDLAEKVKRLANENGRMNTDFYYAYELVGILSHIRDKTFVFDAPPIVGRAEPQTMDLLQEATRCYLFGLHRACVAVCRTALEDSLRQRTGIHHGDLVKCIKVAAHTGVLPPKLTGTAHDIRRRANRVLHSADGDVEDPWQLLLDTRTIVDAIHARPAKL